MLPAWWARATPSAPAVISSTGTVSFSELNGRANQLARALRRGGLQAGDAVAVLCGNQVEFAETAFATTRAGFRLTPINRYLTGAEVAYILQDCDAKALVADGSLAQVAMDALAGAPGCRIRLLVGSDAGADPERGVAGFEDYTAVRDAEDAADLADPVAGTTMLYTSGTTGRPKGVYRTPASAASMLGANIYGYRESGGDVHLCTGPLHHAAPLAFSLAAPIGYGACTVLMERFDAARALELIETYGVTHTHMVPTMFHRLLSLPAETRQRHDLSTLRYVLHGAAPCPVTVKHRVIEWLGPIVWEYYAASEGIGSFVDSATWLAHPGTVGKPYTERQMIVGDENGEEMAVNETGLIWIPGAGRRPLRVLQGLGEDVGQLPRRLLHAGRRGPSRRRGLLLPHGPVGQPHHLGWRQHLPGRGRRRPPAAPGRCRRSHDRRAGLGVGRVGAGRGGAAAGCRGLRRTGNGAHRVVPVAARGLQVPAIRRLRRRAATPGQREDLQAAPARPVPSVRRLKARPSPAISGQDRVERTARPSPFRSPRALVRPAIAMRIEMPRPATSGPEP